MATTTSSNLLLLRRQACTETVLAAKKNLNRSWEEIAKAVGRSPVWVTSCVLGENSMDEESAGKLVKFLEICDDTTQRILTESPLKGQTPASVLLQDPCIYRLHEVNLVYGLTIKELIQEKFGDGIMSAIDFEMEVERDDTDPKCPRVKIIMSGKYLPYRRW